MTGESQETLLADREARHKGIKELCFMHERNLDHFEMDRRECNAIMTRIVERLERRSAANAH